MTQTMLNAILNFGSLAVVESVERAYEITCNTSDSLESNAFANHSVFINGDLNIIHDIPPVVIRL